MDTVVIHLDASKTPEKGFVRVHLICEAKAHDKFFVVENDELTLGALYLVGLIEGLKLIKKPVRIMIETHSQFVRRGVHFDLPKWKARGWKSTKGPLANSELWKVVDDLLTNHAVGSE